MSDPFVFQVVQPHLDALLGGIIVDGILTGTYAVTLYITTVPMFREGGRILPLILILLFSLNIIYYGTAWQQVRQIFIVHNSSRETMYTQFLQQKASQVQDVALLISVLIADALLAWRCCVLWRGRKFVYALFALLFFAEIAIIPVFIIQDFFKLNVGPEVSFLCVFLFISVGLTISATALITYRIIEFGKTGTYSFVVEAVVQSGAMYSLTLFISSTLLAIRATHPADHSLIQATSYGGQLIPPITGIATTLISSRITSRSVRAETGASTGLVFDHPPITNSAVLDIDATMSMTPSAATRLEKTSTNDTNTEA